MTFTSKCDMASGKPCRNCRHFCGHHLSKSRCDGRTKSWMEIFLGQARERVKINGDPWLPDPNTREYSPTGRMPNNKTAMAPYLTPPALPHMIQENAFAAFGHPMPATQFQPRTALQRWSGAAPQFAAPPWYYQVPKPHRGRPIPAFSTIHPSPVPYGSGYGGNIDSRSWTPWSGPPTYGYTPAPGYYPQPPYYGPPMATAPAGYVIDPLPDTDDDQYREYSPSVGYDSPASLLEESSTGLKKRQRDESAEAERPERKRRILDHDVRVKVERRQSPVIKTEPLESPRIGNPHVKSDPDIDDKAVDGLVSVTEPVPSKQDEEAATQAAEVVIEAPRKAPGISCLIQ